MSAGKHSLYAVVYDINYAIAKDTGERMLYTQQVLCVKENESYALYTSKADAENRAADMALDFPGIKYYVVVVPR